MPAERPPTKASENRRATKPIMEKRRRARINQCLSELKALILDALNKDPSRHSKLEKADILEMTVRHLQNIQRQQMAAAISTDPSVLNKFKAGFNECASEVSRYIGRIEGVDPALRQRLLAHLSNCMTTMNAASTTFQPPTSASLGFTGTFPGMMSSLQSLSVQIPGNIASLVSNSNNSRSDINNNTNGHPSPISSTSSTGKLFGGLPLIPSRLPNGDFAFLLPSHALSQQQSCQLFGLPSGSASSSLPSQSSAPDRTSNSSWPPDSPSSRRSASPATSDNSALSPTGSDGGSDVFVDSYGNNKHHMQHKDVVVLSASSVPSSVIRRTPPVVVMRQDDVDRDNDHLHLQHHSLRSQQSIDGESVWRPW